jgi:hypothetical protein
MNNISIIIRILFAVTIFQQFSSGYITVQGGLLYWLVSLIQIGSATLMIGSLLQVMFSALVQDLSLGPVRNNMLLHFL